MMCCPFQYLSHPHPIVVSLGEEGEEEMQYQLHYPLHENRHRLPQSLPNQLRSHELPNFPLGIPSPPPPYVSSSSAKRGSLDEAERLQGGHNVISADGCEVADILNPTKPPNPRTPKPQNPRNVLTSRAQLSQLCLFAKSRNLGLKLLLYRGEGRWSCCCNLDGEVALMLSKGF